MRFWEAFKAQNRTHTIARARAQSVQCRVRVCSPFLDEGTRHQNAGKGTPVTEMRAHPLHTAQTYAMPNFMIPG